MNIKINQDTNIEIMQVLLSIINEVLFNKIKIDPEKNTLSINKTTKGIKSADNKKDHKIAINAETDINIWDIKRNI